MEAYFGREADEIIYPSIQNHFSKSLEETEDVLSEFKISKSFILTVALLSQEKFALTDKLNGSAKRKWATSPY